MATHTPIIILCQTMCICCGIKFSLFTLLLILENFNRELNCRCTAHGHNPRNIFCYKHGHPPFFSYMQYLYTLSRQLMMTLGSNDSLGNTWTN